MQLVFCGFLRLARGNVIPVTVLTAAPPTQECSAFAFRRRGPRAGRPLGRGAWSTLTRRAGRWPRRTSTRPRGAPGAGGDRRGGGGSPGRAGAVRVRPERGTRRILESVSRSVSGPATRHSGEEVTPCEPSHAGRRVSRRGPQGRALRVGERISGLAPRGGVRRRRRQRGCRARTVRRFDFADGPRGEAADDSRSGHGKRLRRATEGALRDHRGRCCRCPRGARRSATRPGRRAGGRAMPGTRTLGPRPRGSTGWPGPGLLGGGAPAFGFGNRR